MAVYLLTYVRRLPGSIPAVPPPVRAAKVSAFRQPIRRPSAPTLQPLPPPLPLLLPLLLLLLLPLLLLLLAALTGYVADVNPLEVVAARAGRRGCGGCVHTCVRVDQ